jgi:aldehyde dehydrogenase (NAD+)
MATELVQGIETEKNWIGGEWVAAASGKTFENRNPADKDDLVGVYPMSDERDVNAAVAAAKKAFPIWRDTPAPRRAEVLYAAGEILKRDKDKLARLMTREMGKVLAEAGGDVQEAIDMAFLAAGEGRRLFGFTTPSELPNKFAMCVRQPVGVCAFVTPWNFPMAIPSWKGMAALIAGNTVVIKPATDTPASVLALARVFDEAGLPKGAWNVVMGSGGEVGDPLVSHPDVKVVSFTGSTEVGRRISVACAPTFKRLHLEMGGKNAILVMDDAIVDLAVEGALWGAFGTTGQRCTASSRLLVHRKVYDEFVGKLVAGARSSRSVTASSPASTSGRASPRSSATTSRSTWRSAKTRARSSSAAARSSRKAASRRGGSSRRRSSRTRTRGCASPARRSSGR